MGYGAATGRLFIFGPWEHLGLCAFWEAHFFPTTAKSLGPLTLGTAYIPLHGPSPT